MVDTTQLEQALVEMRQGPKNPKGQLGYTVSGSYSVVVPGEPARYYVRFPDGSFLKPLHKGRVGPFPDLWVEVGVDSNGENELIGVDSTRMEQQLGSFAANATTGIHSHERGSGNEFPIDARLLYNLNARVVSGTTIRLDPGYYSVNGVLYKWSGGPTYDLSADLPGTSAQHAAGVISIDPTTTPHSLVVTVGTAQSVALPLTDANYLTVAQTALDAGYLPVNRVLLTNGATTFTEYDFESLARLYEIGGLSMPLTTLELADATELTLASDAITITQSYHTVAAESGTDDDLATINGGTVGQVLILQAASGDSINVVDSGNIVLSSGGSRYTLSSESMTVLFYDGTNWRDLDSAAGVDLKQGGAITATQVRAIDFIGGAVVTADGEVYSSLRKVFGGRVSLVSGSPYSDATGATSVYITPGYEGDLIPLYDTGESQWIVRQFSEASLSLAGFAAYSQYTLWAYWNTTNVALEAEQWTQPSGSINSATNANPIVAGTSAVHGLSVGDYIRIVNVGGNTAANGVWYVSAVPTTTSMTLEGSRGSGAYTSGGTWYKLNNSRPTAVELLNGMPVKVGDNSRLWVADLMIGATAGQTDFNDERRFLWNVFNQRPYQLIIVRLPTPFTYNAASWTYYNNDSTNLLELFLGLSSAVTFGAGGTLRAGTTGLPGLVGFGVNRSGSGSVSAWRVPVTSDMTGGVARPLGLAAGYNFVPLLMFGNATSAPTFSQGYIGLVVEM